MTRREEALEVWRRLQAGELFGPVTPPASDIKTCCGLPMSTLEVFGIRLYRCSHRPHHPVIFRNLNTGEELTESYDDGRDGGLRWTAHGDPE